LQLKIRLAKEETAFLKGPIRRKYFLTVGIGMRLLILPLKLAVKIFHAHYMDADLTADFVGLILRHRSSSQTRSP